MPSIDLYLDEADGKLLLARLNSDDEIAFVLEEDRVDPRFVESLAVLPPGDHLLFHDSYDSIPRYDPPSDDEKVLGDEVYSLLKMDPPAPLSGVDLGHPAIFRLSVRYTQPSDGGEAIGLSHIAWTGNRYASLGTTATSEATRWWRRLNAWIGRTAGKVSRSGPLDEFPDDLWVWAFPSALASIESGSQRAENPPG